MVTRARAGAPLLYHSALGSPGPSPPPMRDPG